MEKMILSICELEITSALCSTAFVVVKWTMADPQILTCYFGKTILDCLIQQLQQEEYLSKHKP